MMMSVKKNRNQQDSYGDNEDGDDDNDDDSDDNDNTLTHEDV